MRSKRFVAFVVAAFLAVGVTGLAEAQSEFTPGSGSSARQATDLDGPSTLPEAEMPSLASAFRWSLSWVWVQVPGLQPLQMPLAAHAVQALHSDRRWRLR